jgi:hypothetical protein
MDLHKIPALTMPYANQSVPLMTFMQHSGQCRLEESRCATTLASDVSGAA